MNFPQLEGDCIYHYTKMETLGKICDKDKISFRLTKASCMEDVYEGKEIFRYFRRICKSMLFNNKITEAQYEMLNNINVLENKEAEKERKVIVERNEGLNYYYDYKHTEAYMICFSTVCDSKEMWEYYNGDGLCLHINERDLKNAFHQDCEMHVSFDKVIYNAQEKKDILIELINNFVQTGDLKRVKYEIWKLQYFFKDSFYAFENEKRLLIEIPMDSPLPNPLNGKNYIFLYSRKKFLCKGLTIGPKVINKKKIINKINELDDIEYALLKLNIKESNIF